MIMAQGLKCLEQKEYENSISFFSKAQQKIPGNRDPYFLRAVSIVRFTLHKPIKPKTKNKMLRDSKRDLNRALKHSPKDYQVMYFRAVINFSLHYFYDAIMDLETVIEKSEETNAKYYLTRGRCYACLSMFKEAITDLSIAINLNKELLDVSVCFIISVGVFEQRQMCLSNRRHRSRFYGLSKAYSVRTSMIPSLNICLEKPNGSHIRRQLADDHWLL